MENDQIVVVAFGGNALIQSDEPGFEADQLAHARSLADALLPLVEAGHRLLVVHGNGPQVGNSLIRVEESVPKVPGLSLEACVAETEGLIGFFLELGFRNSLAAAGRTGEIVSVLTPVEVAADDPGLAWPTKPIGPFYSRYRADYLVRMFDWDLVEDAGRGYRRVVASPKPVRILNAELVAALLSHARVVIAGGGGGIPVSLGEDGWAGVEAVIDKDYTAALLAEATCAGMFLILTAVDHVSLDYGSENERPVRRVTATEAEELARDGHFPPGSMGPKIEAAVSFARRRGGEVLITSVPALDEALAGRAGTRIVPDAGDGE